MALSEHVVREPWWLRSLVEDVVQEAMTPTGAMGPLGYRYWNPGAPDNAFDGWQVIVYPAPVLVSGPSRYDGCKFVSGFRLNVGRILDVFTDVEAVVWNMPAQYNNDLDGPEFSVQGHFAGKHVILRVFHLPPTDEPASFAVDLSTGDIDARPV